MPLLQVERLRVEYGAVAAVVDVSLTVERGEMVALLGPNGAGKTTLLKAIGGLLSPASGTIVLDGHQLHRLRGDQIARRGISLVPEGRGIFPGLSVEENLRMGGYWAGRDFERRLARVTQYFPILRDRRRQAAGSLSGGEQQQLAIARALMAEPKLLMLDELSLGLAPRVVAGLFGILRQINADGTAVLLVEQQVPQALALVSRVYVLERGRITLSGSSAQVGADVARLARSYLGAERSSTLVATEREDCIEVEQLAVPLSHRDRRALQSLADRAGQPVGAYVARVLAEHLEATGARHKNGSPPVVVRGERGCPELVRVLPSQPSTTAPRDAEIP